MRRYSFFLLDATQQSIGTTTTVAVTSVCRNHTATLSTAKPFARSRPGSFRMGNQKNDRTGQSGELRPAMWRAQQACTDGCRGQKAGKCVDRWTGQQGFLQSICDGCPPVHAQTYGRHLRRHACLVRAIALRVLNPGQAMNTPAQCEASGRKFD